LNFLSYEAAAAVSEEVSKGIASDECILFVFYKVLLIFSQEITPDGKGISWRKRYHKRFIPIATFGLRSASRLADGLADFTRDISLTWAAFANFLSHALSPVSLGENLTKIPRVSELLEIIEIAVASVPKSFALLLCKALAEGLTSSFKAANQHARFSNEHASTDVGRKSKKHRDELTKLFKSCFNSCCLLGPEEKSIREVAHETLSGALSAQKEDPERAVLLATSLAVCQVIQKRENMHTLVISLFPVLTQLVTSEEEELKTAVCGVFKAVNVSGILEEARIRYESAEQRAKEAEHKVETLAACVAELKR
jgi:hypothetical protein